MNGSVLWTLAARSLFRHRRRTLATSSAVILGLCGLFLLFGYIIRVERILRLQTIYLGYGGHITVAREGFARPIGLNAQDLLMTSEEQNRLAGILDKYQDKIEFVGTLLESQGLVANGSRSVPVRVTALAPDFDRYVRTHPLPVRWAQDFLIDHEGRSFGEEVQLTREAISITASMGEMLSLSIPFKNQTVEKRELQLAGRTIQGDFNAVNVIVNHRHTTGVALLEDSSLLMGLDLAQELFDTQGVNKKIIYLKSDKDLKKIVSEIQSTFKAEGLKLEAVPFNDDKVGQFYNGTMSFLYTMALFFFILIFGAVLIAIVNTITLGIIERTKEIGTLKSLGFRESGITSIFLREAFLMAMASGVISLTLAKIAAFLINSSGLKFTPPGTPSSVSFIVLPEMWFCLPILVGMVILIVLVSLYVIRNKTKVKVVDLLGDPGAHS